MDNTEKRLRDLIEASSFFQSLVSRDSTRSYEDGTKDFYVLMIYPNRGEPVGYIIDAKDVEYLMDLPSEEIPRELAAYPDNSLLHRKILQERLVHGL